MKTYSTKHFKPIENEELCATSATIYPNTKIFSNANQVLQSFGIVLELLHKTDYDTERLIPLLSGKALISDNDFSIDTHYDVASEAKYSPEQIFDEQTNECVIELYYSDTYHTIIDNTNEIEIQAQLYIDLDCIKLYVNGSALYIDDQIIDKKVLIYFK